MKFDIIFWGATASWLNSTDNRVAMEIHKISERKSKDPAEKFPIDASGFPLILAEFSPKNVSLNRWIP